MQADYRVQLAAQYLAEVGSGFSLSMKPMSGLSGVPGCPSGAEDLQGSQSPSAVFQLLDGAVGRVFAEVFRLRFLWTCLWRRRRILLPRLGIAALPQLQASRRIAVYGAVLTMFRPRAISPGEVAGTGKSARRLPRSTPLLEEIIESHTEKRLITRQMMEEEV